MLYESYLNKAIIQKTKTVISLNYITLRFILLAKVSNGVNSSILNIGPLYSLRSFEVILSAEGIFIQLTEI